jgi:hypothetical protein
VNLSLCHVCGRDAAPLSLYCERCDDGPTRGGSRLVAMLVVVATAVVLLAATVALRSCS